MAAEHGITISQLSGADSEVLLESDLVVEEPVKRLIAVIDDDPDFPHLIAGCLGDVAIEVEVVAADDEPVPRVRELAPELLFISVELPESSGYSLFSRMKKALGNQLPIVMATATLPQRDMDLHAKQRLHADAYLRKTLPPLELQEELLGILDRLTGLNSVEPSEAAEDGAPNEEGLCEEKETLDTDEVQQIEDETPSSGDESEADEDTRGDDENNGEEGAREPNAEEPGAEEPGAEEPGAAEEHGAEEDKARLASDNRQLRLELEGIRRSMASTPFSNEFLQLSQDNREKDQALQALQGQLEIRDQELEKANAELRELDGRLTDSIQETDARMAEARQEMEGFRGQVAARAEKIHRQHLEALNQLRDELKEEKRLALTELEKTRQEERDILVRDQQHALEGLGKDHSSEVSRLQEQAISQVTKLEERLEEEKCHAVEQLKQAQESHQHTRELYKAKLAEYKSHNQTLEVLRKQERDAANKAVQTVARLEEKNQRLEILEREFSVQVETAHKERLGAEQRLARLEEEMEASEEAWRGRLEKAKKESRGRLEMIHAEYVEDSDARESEFQELLDKTKSDHRRELSDLGNKRTQLEARAVELETQLETAAEEHVAETVEIRQTFSKEQTGLETRLAEIQARLEAQEEKDRESQALQRESEALLRQTRGEKKKAVRSLESRLEQAKKAHERSIEKLRAGLEQAGRQHREALDKAFQDRQAERRELSGNVRRLETRLQEVEARAEQAEKARARVTETQARATEVQARVAAAEEKLKAAEHEAREAGEKARQTELRNDQAVKQQQEAESLLREAENLLRGAEERADETERRLAATVANLADTQARLQQLEESNEVLEKRLLKTQQEDGSTIEQILQEKDSLALQLEQAELGHAKGVALLREKHRAELAASGEEIHRAQEEIGSLHNQVEETQSKMDQALEQERALRQNLDSSHQAAMDDAVLSVLADQEGSASAKREELEQSLGQRHQQAMQSLEQKHQEDLAAATQEGRKAMEEAEKNFAQHLELQREADRREAEADRLQALGDLEDRMRKEKAEAVASTFEDRRESETPVREKLESLERERDAWRAERETWRAELELERETFASRLNEEIEQARQAERQEFENLATKQSGRLAELEVAGKQEASRSAELELQIHQFRDRASLLEVTAEKRQAMIKELEHDALLRHTRYKELEEIVDQLRREHADALAALAFESREKAKKSRDEGQHAEGRDEREKALRESLNQMREELKTSRLKSDAAVDRLRQEQRLAEAKWLAEKQQLVDLHQRALGQQTQKYRQSLSELETKHRAALEKVQDREPPLMEKVAAGAGPQEVLKAEWTAHQQTKQTLRQRDVHVAQLLEHIEVERAETHNTLQELARVESTSAVKISQIEGQHREAMAAVQREFSSRVKVLVEFWNEIEDLPQSDDTDRFARLLKDLFDQP